MVLQRSNRVMAVHFCRRAPIVLQLTRAAKSFHRTIILEPASRRTRAQCNVWLHVLLPRHHLFLATALLKNAFCTWKGCTNMQPITGGGSASGHGCIPHAHSRLLHSTPPLPRMQRKQREIQRRRCQEETSLPRPPTAAAPRPEKSWRAPDRHGAKEHLGDNRHPTTCP